jgi:hypothetical protein
MERKACYTIIVLFFSWLSLVSCTYNPLSNSNNLTGSPAGAAIGAGVGAGSTALLDAPTPIVVLAGLGGAGIGYYVTSLRFDASGIVHAGGQVFTLGDYVTIEIPSDSLFDTNSDEFLPDAEPILISTLTVLKRYPDNNIVISGNTSGFNSEKYEQPLSEQRARQVASYLWANGFTSGFKENSNEVKDRRLIYIGYGNYFPIANNIKSHSIRQNSRIQITSFPSYANMKLNKACLFSNIGSANSKPLTSRSCDASNNDFKSETFAESKKENYKGEGLTQDFNSIANSFHTNEGGKVAKHGGFKGEAGFKGEEF